MFYGKDQDIYNPLHYLPLDEWAFHPSSFILHPCFLEQRPGAFQHAKPLRRWRASWPPVYERLLARLQTESDGIREFVRILRLHQEYPAQLYTVYFPVVEQAVTQALEYRCLHLDGIKLCLPQLMHPALALAWVSLGKDEW